MFDVECSAFALNIERPTFNFNSATKEGTASFDAVPSGFTLPS